MHAERVMKGRLMAAEMAEQPAILEALLQRRLQIVAQVRALLPHSLSGIVLVARGSSDHAAMYGRYLFEMVSRRPAGLAAPSIQTLYECKVDFRGYLAVAISQSGRTPEVVTVLRRMRASGARTVAIVNEGSSPLERSADVTLNIEAGTERAVPATKSVTATLLALGIVAQALGRVPWRAREIAAIPETISALLGDGHPSDDVAREITSAGRVIITGRGLMLGAAFETALKIRETSSIFAEAISAADLRHGPIATIGRGFPVLVLSGHGGSAADARELAAHLRRRGALVTTVGPGPRAAIPLPAALPEALLPIAAVVRAQQLAQLVARVRGLDADAPAGLRKVTLTR
jgi:glutamine---fructose-6-phosphate transaminase (isomerizing)